jgi:hypothetical protein
VVVGNSPVERYWTSELHRAFQQFTDRVNITWFNDLTFGEMQERAASMSPSSVIFWFLLSEDAAGVPFLRIARSIRCVKNPPSLFLGWVTIKWAGAWLAAR